MATLAEQSFIKSDFVIAVTVKKIIQDSQASTPEERTALILGTRIKIDKLKRKLSSLKNYPKRIQKIKFEIDELETQYSIYKIENDLDLDLDSKKIDLGYDGSYDGQLTLETIVTESYKGGFANNVKYSFSERRRSWGQCNNFNNEYVYTAKVDDIVVMYVEQGTGVIGWEVFSDKEKMSKKMLKVKNDAKNNLQFYIKGLFSIFR